MFTQGLSKMERQVDMVCIIMQKEGSILVNGIWHELKVEFENISRENDVFHGKGTYIGNNTKYEVNNLLNLH